MLTISNILVYSIYKLPWLAHLIPSCLKYKPSVMAVRKNYSAPACFHILFAIESTVSDVQYSVGSAFVKLNTTFLNFQIFYISISSPLYELFPLLFSVFRNKLSCKVLVLPLGPLVFPANMSNSALDEEATDQ